MKVVTDVRQLPSGCAFVPTMGALHAGHASLMSIAKEHSENVVVSIFVNPLQFESSEDLAKYPRTPEADIELAAANGVTHLWLPPHAEIYPKDHPVLTAGLISHLYEGKSRPGHFYLHLRMRTNYGQRWHRSHCLHSIMPTLLTKPASCR